MITLTVILSILALTIVWALFVPFTVEIDTDRQFYTINLPGLIGIKALKTNNKWHVKGNIFFIRFNLLKKGKERFKMKKEKYKRKNKSKKSISNPVLFVKEAFKYIGKTLDSFRVKRFKAEFDSGDNALNAQLYPIVATTTGNHVQVNFENRNSIDLKANGQVFFIAWYALRFYLKNKYLIIKK